MYQEKETDFGKIRPEKKPRLSPQEVPGVLQLLLDKVDRLEARISHLSQLLETKIDTTEMSFRDNLHLSSKS